jgi:hypothetical protein
MREKLFESTVFSFSGRETKWLEATRSHRRRQLMMCKNQYGRPTLLSLMEDLKQKRLMTTTKEHRWGVGQSSSDAFVRDFGKMINR